VKLTTKTRYSLKILTQLALDFNKKPIKGKDIANEHKMSEAYLEQIMITLKSAGLIKTERGCNGGYILAKHPSSITALQIIELFEGKIEFSECRGKKRECSLLGKCATTNVWTKLSSALKNEAAKITIESIIDDYIFFNTQEYII